MTRAYYNECDPYAAQWLRNLIAAGELPEGDVDDRDIRDVQPADVRGYDHCHFFAGIGGWALALRLAGWPDDRPVWTASCPCQPFSAAGRRKGKEDDRHLWPEFRRLLDQCAPRAILGEQVASKDGLRDWYLAGVCPDLEARGYDAGAVDLPAACLGAPHIRQRLWWVAHARGAERRALPERWRDDINGDDARRRQASSRSAVDCETGRHGLGHAPRERREGLGLLLQPGEPREAGADVDRAGEGVGDPSSTGAWWDTGAVPNAEAEGQRSRLKSGRIPDRAGVAGADDGWLEYAESDRWHERRTESGERRSISGCGSGPWDDYDLVSCRQPDGSLVARRLEPGLAPLVDGFSCVVADGRARQDAPRGQILKGLGNAIVVPLAVAFIESVMEEYA